MKEPKTPGEAMANASRLCSEVMRQFGIELTPDQTRELLDDAFRRAVEDFWHDFFLDQLNRGRSPGSDSK